MKNFKKLISLALSAVMLAATLPMSAMAAAETKSVVEDIDWENWLIPDAVWSSHLDNSTYYVDGGWWCSNAMGDGKFSLEINDTGAEAHAISATAGHPSDGKAWGFKGTKYYTGWLGEVEGAKASEFPADRWLGVKDISAHKDTGYAVFTINNVTGDADNAYLAIKTAPQDWDIEELVHRMLGNALVDSADTNAFPITPERYPVRNVSEPFKEFYNTKITGVKLTDYYDVAKGGSQTVAVPLSKFAAAPDFVEVFSTNGGQDAATFEAKRNLPLDLRLFAGMGIARKNSGEGKTFSAGVTDLAIVDPKTPENLLVEQDGENVVIVFDVTTDTDVAFKVKKTCNGIVEYIDAPEGVATDVIDTSKSYMYQAVAVNETYGVEAASVPYFIGSAGVETLKAQLNWKDYVGEGGDSWHNYMEGECYSIGKLGVYNDFEGFQYCAGSNFNVNIDDNGANTGYSIAKQFYENTDTVDWVDGIPSNSSALVNIPNDDGYWGFNGMTYQNLRSYPDMSKVPDDVWFGIKSIKDYEESGYAVFTVNSVSGDAENAFLSIVTLTDPWQIEAFAATGAELPIKKADYPDANWGEHYMTLVAGAKLTDYYDVEKGGVQTVAVPLSKLVNDPDIQELRGKVYASMVEKMTREDYEFIKPELHLFKAMGIARRDSGSDKTFSASIAEMKIVGLQIPQNLVGTENADGSISFTFETTSDIGVSYKIARTSGGVTEYFDAPGGAFTDKNVDPKKEYTYTAVAYEPELKIYSAGSNEYVKAMTLEPVVRENIDWANWIKPSATYSSFLDGESLNADWWCAGSNATMTLALGDAVINDASADVSSDGKAWAFKGSRYYTGWLGDDGALVSTFPADRWLGVKDISAYKNNGYAAFTIDSVTGDAENAYLAIATAASDWDVEDLVVRMLGSASVNPEDTNAFPITPERYPVRFADQPFKQFYSTKVVGVKLTDYYNVERGGQQTVLVPLSVLADSPVFSEAFMTSGGDAAKHEEKRGCATDLRLFSGMGVARKDSGAAEEFTATVSKLQIVAVNAPSNVAAEVNEDGDVVVTFDKTMDKDVAFKVKRTSGSEVAYFDAPDGVYVDTTRDAGKTYTYTAVAVCDEFAIEEESADSAVVERDVINYAKLFAGDVETKYVKAGTMTAKFFASDVDATGYIAKYDASGRLTGANLVIVPAGEEKAASLEVAATDLVKVMLWAGAEALVPAITATEKPVKVLYIGDEDVLVGAEYVDELAAADELAIEVVSAYYDDAAISNHVANIASGDAKYTVAVNGTVKDGKAALADLIAGDEWDKILVQEDLEKAIAGNGYEGFKELVPAIAELSDADVSVVDGWCQKANFEDDFSTLSSAAESAIVDTGATIFSSAMAFLLLNEGGLELWNANDTGLSDAGKYTVSLVIYKNVVAGADIEANTFAPAGVEEAELIKGLVAGV